MDDTKKCPVCGLKLRTINLKNKFLHGVGKQSDYIERCCTKGINHTVQFFSDKKTGKIDFMKLSLSNNYSKFLEIDFINRKCRISCYKSGQPGKTEYIDINKMIFPDFPNLTDLKLKVNMYITFS